jgi:hypothetical protein
MRLPSILTALLICTATVQPSQAGWFSHREKTVEPGRPRSFAHTQQRAGNPQYVSPLAHFTRSPMYVGYYVGGGTGCCSAEPRRIDEGTWGMDYKGHWLPRRVDLGWSHGRLYQGGTGSYVTEGIAAPAARSRHVEGAH